MVLKNSGRDRVKSMLGTTLNIAYNQPSNVKSKTAATPWEIKENAQSPL